MSASVSALYRHPVKGFTPEPLDRVSLTAGRHFPGDRLYAVEVGPSGFDPDTPGHVSKMKFVVLARFAAVAKVRTRWDAATGLLSARREGRPDLDVDLDDPADRRRLEAWLSEALGDDVDAPLKVLSAKGHRFMDDPAGHVSILNLASVRDFEARLGRPVDPLRFRANIHVEGWPAWVENDWAGREIAVGGARLAVVKPIVRCGATHVDPATGERDIDLVPALFETYGHRWCGLYLSVMTDGPVAIGDPVEIFA
ncbi:MOSC domain-containing protein [Brevundimonas variabilis]|uniref:MOSC domain-containing protein n=1 Tax=Brevundimonas variabilis TaxID=74312 RepID=UPI0016069ACE